VAYLLVGPVSALSLGQAIAEPRYQGGRPARQRRPGARDSSRRVEPPGYSAGVELLTLRISYRKHRAGSGSSRWYEDARA
jgi:hypothetical protein